MHFLNVLEAGSPRSRCQPGWALVGAILLACRWLLSLFDEVERERNGQRDGHTHTVSPLLLIKDHGFGFQPTSLVAQMVRNPPAMQEMWIWSLGGEDPLEKEMAPHSSIPAWRIPGQGSLVGHSPRSHKEVDDLSDFHFSDLNLILFN